MKERYHISGMTCSACSSHVEKAANKLAGVEKASVNLLTETMEIEYDENKLSREQIESAVEKAGYGAALIIGGKSGAGTARIGAGETEAGGTGRSGKWKKERKGQCFRIGKGRSQTNEVAAGDFHWISDSSDVCGNASYVQGMVWNPCAGNHTALSAWQ